MRGLFSLGRGARAVVGVAVGAVAITGALVPLAASPAQAVLANVTFIGNGTVSPSSAYANANGINFPDADSVVTYSFRVNSTPDGIARPYAPYAHSSVLAQVTSGPDLGRLFDCGPDASLAHDPLVVTCFVGNDSNKGLGVDSYRFFVDKNRDATYNDGEPFTTSSATYVGAPDHVGLTTAAATAQGTCTPITASLLDAAGRNLFGQNLIFSISQPGANDTSLNFCSVNTNPELTGADGQALSSPGGVTKTFQPLTGYVTAIKGSAPTGDATSRGRAVALGYIAGTQAPVSIDVFRDLNGNGTLDAGDAVATRSGITVNPGLQNGGTQISLSTAPGVVEFNHPGGFSPVATVRNASGNPVQGAKVCYVVTGANPTPVNSPVCPNDQSSLTNGLGQVKLTYLVPQQGDDTVTAFIDYTSGVVGQRDSNEPQTSATLKVINHVSEAAIDVTAVGSAAGGSTRSSTDNAIASNSILPAHADPRLDPNETISARVINRVTNLPVPNVVVKFAVVPYAVLASVPTSPAPPAPENQIPDGGTVNGGAATFAVTDANGLVHVTFAPGAVNPAAGPGATRDGYVYQIFGQVLAVDGPSVVDLARVMYALPDVKAECLRGDCAGKFRGYFPLTRGTLTLSPTDVVTAPRTTQAFTATLLDQFGAPAGNVPLQLLVSGRNPLNPAPLSPATPGNNDTAALTSTNEQGQYTFQQVDNGPADQGSSGFNTATYDRLFVIADPDKDGINPKPSVPNDPVVDPGSSTFGLVSATRKYDTAALGSSDAAAVEGGVGTAAEQFSGTSAPYNPVTSDDTKSQAIDLVTARASQTPINVFFEARNLDNSSHLKGSKITVTNTGVGGLVGLNNTPADNPGALTINDNGFVQVKALSTAVGTQTITGTMGGFSKSVTITWTNTGGARYIAVTPSTANVVPTQVTNVTVKVTDVWGNSVAGQLIGLTISGPGVFTVNNGTSGAQNTDATGTIVAPVKATASGNIVVTATGTGAQFTAPVNTPEAGKSAGNGVATSTLTSSSTSGIPSQATLTVSPSGQTHQVGTAMTVTGVLKDADGNALPGKTAKFIVTGATGLTSPVLTSNNNGVVTLNFTSNNVGTAHVKLSVIDDSGAEYFNQSVDVAFIDPNRAPTPVLNQSSDRGVVGLFFQTAPRFQGLTVYFFRKSGITGKVVPLGTGEVTSSGLAKRFFFAQTGQILALYGKVIGADNIVSPYSNTIAFRVR